MGAFESLITRVLWRKWPIIIFWLAYCASTPCAQTPGPRSPDATRSLNYGFVSPNTRENLKLQDAIRNLYSSEETQLIRKAKELGCRTRTTVLTLRALGSWSDGAEHSLLLRMIADEQTVRYLVSMLGKDGRQKAVLYFHQEKTGTARIYILRPRIRQKSFARLTMVLDEAGVAFRTLVPVKTGILVYVADPQGALSSKIRVVASRLRARVRMEKGRAEFIGDDADRQKGLAAFDKEIERYESMNPNLPATCREARF